MKLRLSTARTSAGELYIRYLRVGDREAADLTCGNRYPNIFLVPQKDQSTPVAAGCSWTETLYRSGLSNAQIRDDYMLIEVRA